MICLTCYEDLKLKEVVDAALTNAAVKDAFGARPGDINVERVDADIESSQAVFDLTDSVSVEPPKRDKAQATLPCPNLAPRLSYQLD